MKILEMLWGGLRAIGRRLRESALLLWHALQSWVTWTIAALTYVLDRVFGWISGAIQSALRELLDAFAGFGDSLGAFPNLAPLAAYYLRDVLAMDEAFRLLVGLAGVWVVARSARWLMVPVRAVLELL